ncbi:uncharacterized protein LOC116847519 [Odontomachus brunneus]|uniref:uncharacterized protein LOC116847519 n=1 Tax=Odontomachus brunneus TaxID=486640 RepID=UPI0013F2065A|nr:uncharacterized protein LOC116847519 [Odontomachus brunneus]
MDSSGFSQGNTANPNSLILIHFLTAASLSRAARRLIGPETRRIDCRQELNLGENFISEISVPPPDEARRDSIKCATSGERRKEKRLLRTDCSFRSSEKFSLRLSPVSEPSRKKGIGCARVRPRVEGNLLKTRQSSAIRRKITRRFW